MPEERWSDMPMKEIPRIPEEEAEKLKNSRFVESVDGHLVILTLEFHLMMYKRWKEFPTAHTVQEFMRRNGIDPDVLGQLYAEALVWDFETYGDPTARPFGGVRAPHQPVERRNDVVLLSTGKFYMAGMSFKWDKEFKKELRACYPMMTVEDSLMQAGINPALIDNARIRAVTHRFKQDEERRQKALISCGRPELAQDKEKQPGEKSAYRYLSNPYVEEVTSNCTLMMKEEFFNEVYYLDSMQTEDLLALYGIDAADLSAASLSAIRARRYEWKPTDLRCAEWTELICRIQTARLSALIRQTDESFAKFREAAARLSPVQKKALCRQIAEYPTSYSYACGYSLREILKKMGISKSVYYKALNDSRYGLTDERRRAKDHRDLEKIIRVMEYKGFEKGVRQIYMMMPDLAGETFAISKIRRLLRQNGIRTKVRSENPARQRMGKFMERNRKQNLLRREFRLHRPNEVRLTDVTYLDYGTGEEKQRAYGSSCIDPVTGRLLVFHVAENNDLDLALETLEKLSDSPAVEGALFHSDQGILYFTDEFQEKVAEMGLVQSMSKRGNCWDNAPQESFFGHFKDECGYGGCESFEELRTMIDEYAWYYNNERRQWDRKRMTPVQYEAHLLSLDEEGYAEYMRTEREKYDRMKAKAEKQAIERAKTLGV